MLNSVLEFGVAPPSDTSESARWGRTRAASLRATRFAYPDRMLYISKLRALNQHTSRVWQLEQQTTRT